MEESRTSNQGHQIMVLDHGYLQVVESWGSDERIIEAARMSTNKGFQGWGPVHNEHCDTRFASANCTCEPTLGDEKLLAYLYNNKHMSPFEMAGMTIEIQAPIFVFREWHRHRTQSYNEMSSRYTPLPDLNYIPSVERLMMNSKTNKQAGTTKDSVELTVKEAAKFRHHLSLVYGDCEMEYQDYLKRGVPKELARLVLPVGRYSRMRASANLRNWLQFLTLRDADNAQWEIREYARVLNCELREAFPRTMELFNK